MTSEKTETEKMRNVIPSGCPHVAPIWMAKNTLIASTCKIAVPRSE